MLNSIDVVGPLSTEAAAIETAAALGDSNHSVYSRAVKDAEGFDTDGRQWFVERLLNVPGRIFGYDPAGFMKRQYR